MNKLLPILLAVVLSGCAASKKTLILDDSDRKNNKQYIDIEGSIYVPPSGRFLLGLNGLKSSQKQAPLYGFRDKDSCYGTFEGSQVDDLLGELHSFLNVGFWVCENVELKELYVMYCLGDTCTREHPIRNKYKIINE